MQWAPAATLFPCSSLPARIAQFTSPKKQALPSVETHLIQQQTHSFEKRPPPRSDSWAQHEYQVGSPGAQPVSLTRGRLKDIPPPLKKKIKIKFSYPWLPWCLSGKKFACRCRRRGFDPWVGKIPWKRKWQPTSTALARKPRGQKSLMCYIPWGHKQSDMTFRLNDIYGCPGS